MDAVRAVAVSALRSPSRTAIRSARPDARAAGMTSSRTPARRPAADRVSMKRFRACLEGLPGGHRPPTGPLTTRRRPRPKTCGRRAWRRMTSGSSTSGKTSARTQTPPPRSRFALRGASRSEARGGYLTTRGLPSGRSGKKVATLDERQRIRPWTALARTNQLELNFPQPVSLLPGVASRTGRGGCLPCHWPVVVNASKSAAIPARSRQRQPKARAACVRSVPVPAAKWRQPAR